MARREKTNISKLSTEEIRNYVADPVARAVLLALDAAEKARVASGLIGMAASAYQNDEGDWLSMAETGFHDAALNLENWARITASKGWEIQETAQINGQIIRRRDNTPCVSTEHDSSEVPW